MSATALSNVLLPLPPSRGLAMPVLAIGAEKAFGANVAVVMRNAATNVREVVAPNAGHWLMEEAPGATIAAVQDFLAAGKR
jgi:pimeloyl-ACP methyl ester carboxylesterase